MTDFAVVVTECAVGLTSDPQECLKEMSRVASPGGHVVIHESVWLKPVQEKRRAEIVSRLGTVPYALDEWKAMMERAGLEEIWSEDWSGLENALKMRPGRKPRSTNDIFSPWEILSMVLPRVVSRYGIGSTVRLFASARTIGPLYSNGNSMAPLSDHLLAPIP